MSVFKNLKSLFVIEEEGSSKKEPLPSPKQDPVVPKPKTNDPVPSVPSGGQAKQEFLDIFFKAMEANNLPGFDYLEFKQTLQSMQNLPMDESTRFKSAFAAAQTMGVNADKLVQTAKHYLEILKKEEEKFGSALNNQIDRQIKSKESEIQGLQDSIKSKAEQIKKLTAEIENQQKTAESLQTEIAQSRVKVESTKNDFMASYNVLVVKIHSDIENMVKYLK